MGDIYDEDAINEAFQDNYCTSFQQRRGYHYYALINRYYWLVIAFSLTATVLNRFPIVP